MKPAADSIRIESLLKMMDEAYDKRAWHGTNLKGSLRGISCQDAVWRPGKNRHNIWEIALHAAYWKYVVLRRLLGKKRGSFDVAGSNWFLRPVDISEKAWKADLRILERLHQELRKGVARLKDKDLDRTPTGSQNSNGFLIRGIAFHDIYHAGQIQLLKRLKRNASRIRARRA
jgi:hypothetical protein